MERIFERRGQNLEKRYLLCLLERQESNQVFLFLKFGLYKGYQPNVGTL